MTKRLALLLFAAVAVWAQSQPLVVSVHPQATQNCCSSGLQIVITPRDGGSFSLGPPDLLWFVPPGGATSPVLLGNAAFTDSSVTAVLDSGLLATAGDAMLRVVWVDLDVIDLPYTINPEPADFFPPYLTVATGRPFSIQMTVEPYGAGTPPFQWSFAPGGPGISGVSISPTGLLSGQISNPTSGSLLVMAKDASEYEITREIFLDAVNPPVVTSVSPNPITPNCCDGMATLEIRGNFFVGDFYPQVRYGIGSAPLDSLEVLDYSPNLITALFPTMIDPGVYWIEVDIMVPSDRYPIALGVPLVVPEVTLAPATVGSSYRQEVSVSGGVPPYTMTASGLPVGIAISGTSFHNVPREAGTFTVLITVTDAIGQSVQRTATLEVTPALSVATTSLAAGTQGQAYSQALAAAGGTAPYRWSLASGALPPGLSLNSDTGLISGTPAQTGAYAFTVGVTDAALRVASRSLSITVAMPLPAHLPPAFLEVPYSVTLPPAGVVPPYAWSIPEGSLPPGLQIGSATGEISGTPTQTGTFTFTAIVAGAQGQSHTGVFVITVTPALVVQTRDAGHATVNTPHSVALYATGGTPPYVWSLADGSLPPGMTMGAEQISGTPEETGTYAFTVKVTDANGGTASRQLAMLVTAQPLSFTLEVSNPAAGGQGNAMAGLSGPSGLNMQGNLTLSFAPDAGMPDDPAIQFANGGRTATFAATTTSQAAVPFQVGTVAGTITIHATVSANGVDVTPSPAPVRTVRIEPAAPVLTSGTARRTSGGLEVTVNGFATSRNITSATFRFTAASGSTLQTSEVTVQVGPAFTTWYSNPSSNQFGSQFQYVQPFTVGGDTQGITSVAVTLANAQGTSTPLTLNF